jgi:phenylacetyl-CoA:acceptor oxidoreductase subunit 1
MNPINPDTRRWAMVIDLRRCIGCGACTLVCGQQNSTPGKFWRKVEELEGDEQVQRQRFFLPLNCMHCENPSCEAVCPTGATFRRSDGIVEIDPERCIGCGYCILACPYRARTIFYDHLDFEIKAPDTRNRNGTCTKCTFCKEKIDRGLAGGLRPGIDPEATPACVVNCSAEALSFGDLNDPQSNVSRLIRHNRSMRINTGLGNEPALYYIVP